MKNVIFQHHNRSPVRSVKPDGGSAFDVDWQALPRIGEYVSTEDQVFRVDMVTHDVTDGAVYITVSLV